MIGVVATFVLVFVGIVVIHEFGHFLFAKIFGVRVLEFAIGFGPAIYKKAGKETLFRINVFPLGGYVRLSGENPEDIEEGDEGKRFYDKPAWQRLLIALAGPVFSIIAGYLIFLVIVNIWGVNLSGVSAVLPNSPAEIAGLRKGDAILKINGKFVFDPMVISSEIKKGERISLVVLRNGEKVSLTVTPVLIDEELSLFLESAEGNAEGKLVSIENYEKYDPEILSELVNRRIKLVFTEGYVEGVLKNYSYTPKRYAIGFVFSGYKPVFKKNTEIFNKGDVLLKVDGISIKNWMDFVKVSIYLSLNKNDAYLELFGNKVDWFTYGPEDNVQVVYKRNGETRKIMIGKENLATIFSDLSNFTPEIKPYKPDSFVERVELAVSRCNWILYLTWKAFFGKGLFRSISKGEVAGPIGIAQMVGTAAKLGLDSVFVLVAIITINLGIFNLLPLPALDGGRIVFSLAEILTRKKLDPKVEALIHTIGFFILFGLLIFVTFVDLGRMIGR